MFYVFQEGILHMHRDGDLELFTFSRDAFAHIMKRRVSPSHLTSAWNKIRGIDSVRILAENRSGFRERAILASDGIKKEHILCLSAVFDEARHTLAEVFIRESGFSVQVGFDLRGIGFQPPANDEQAHRTLRKLGTVLGYIPEGIKFHIIRDELEEWVGLPIDRDASKLLPSGLVSAARVGFPPSHE
ncbi:MAG: hypothetical protein GW778_04820 [Alphaproteobacteria bacterium]|nr:hypothetical protein [Alphaproteobacteria bacterium]